MCFDMVELSDLTPKQRLHVMDSDRYSVRYGQIYDEVTEKLVDVVIFHIDGVD